MALERNATLVSELQTHLPTFPSVILDIVHDFAAEKGQSLEAVPLQGHFCFCDYCCSCRCRQYICSPGRCLVVGSRFALSTCQFLGCCQVALCLCFIPVSCARCCYWYCCAAAPEGNKSASIYQCLVCGLACDCAFAVKAFQAGCHQIVHHTYVSCSSESCCLTRRWVYEPFEMQLVPKTQYML